MDFRPLLHLYKKEIIRVLMKINGAKYLFIDVCLMKRIDSLISASCIKEYQVIKICKLGPVVKNSCSRFVYIIQSEIEPLKKVINQIKSDKKQSINREYSIIFVPEIHFECEELLSRNGLYEEVHIDSILISLIPIAKDILSLGLPHFFYSVFVENSWLWLNQVAQAIHLFERFYGKIPQIHTFGQISANVAHLLESGFEGQTGDNHVSHLLIIDRSVDLVTPFASNITYGGILSEVFGLNEGVITLPKDVKDLIPGRISLCNPDKIFEECCDCHFSKVTLDLSQKVKLMASNMEGKLASTSLEELRKFVSSDLGTFREDQRQLVQHLSACEYIQKTIIEPHVRFSLEHTTIQDPDRAGVVDYIIDLIYREMDLYLGLSLLVILSQSTGLVWMSELEPIIRAFCHVYGFHHVTTFDNLSRGGLISVKTGGRNSIYRLASKIVQPNSQFQNVAKKLNLLPSQKNASEDLWREMTDVSYLFNGCYIPVIYRLVEEFILSVADGNSGKLVSMGSECNLPYSCISRANCVKPGCVMVFVLGGCTMQEVAGIRFLAKKRGFDALIACTSVVNKYDMLRPFVVGQHDI